MIGLSLIIAFLTTASVAAIVYGLRPESAAVNIHERLDGGPARPMTAHEEEMQQSFIDRIVKPVLARLIRAAGRLSPPRNIERLRRDLLLAGSPYDMTATDFLGARTLVSAGGALLALPLVLVSGKLSVQILMVVGGLVMIGFYGPSFWLKRRIKNRQKEIVKALPDALDMLTIAVDAGLGFDAAMMKISEKWHNALAQEFERVVTEIRVGKTRREALRDMSARTAVGDVSNFVAVLVQADQLGLSIARVLHSQSEQLRVRRRQRAEESARQASTKMLFPLVFMIFPAMFAVILGPAIPLFMETFGGM
jgi:tight adherence protein C